MTSVHNLLGQGSFEAVLCLLVQNHIVQDHAQASESQRKHLKHVISLLFLYFVEMSIKNSSIFIWTQVISIKMKQILEIIIQGK